MKLLYLNKNKPCVGCRLCELACSFFHDNIFNPENSRVVVIKEESKGKDDPQICYHCKNHPCTEVCPVDAFEMKITNGEEYYVINNKKCIGCGLCIKACPFDAIHFSLDKKILKCDLCGGIPECVKHCPTGIICFGDLSKTISIKEKSSNNQ